jgi:phosphoglycerate kinase
VIVATDVVGDDARAKAEALEPGQVLLLENLRFDAGETANDDASRTRWRPSRTSTSTTRSGRRTGRTRRSRASRPGIPGYAGRAART